MDFNSQQVDFNVIMFAVGVYVTFYTSPVARRLSTALSWREFDKGGY